MQSRLLPIILLASLAADSAGSALAWSPLQKDVEKDVMSVEKSDKFSKFHEQRAKVDAQLAREKEQEKLRKQAKQWWRLKKPKLTEEAVAEEETEEQPAAAAEEATEEKPTARPRKPGVVPVTKDVSAGELEEGMYEPGMAPAREITDKTDKADKTDLSDDAEATDESDEEGAEEDDKKKKKKIPGDHPTEDVLDPGYFIKRSQSYMRKKDFQSALNYVDRALELQPQNWDAWYQKALTYQMAGYDAAAARRYLKLISHRPDMIEARIAMGMLYRKHENFDLAETEYLEAIEHKYHSFPAHFNLANLYMDQKKFEQALKEYKVCLKLQPNNALVHNNMGVIFQQRNFLEEAADEFRKASHLDPGNKLYIDNLNGVTQAISAKGKRTVQM